MAYTANEVRVTVRGFLQDGAEEFNNVWTVLNLSGGLIADLGVNFHAFYSSIALDEMSSHTTVTSASYKLLSTGATGVLTWATITGNDLADPMPGQLAVRISLQGAGNVQGGPFIPGWSHNAIDDNGMFPHAASVAESATTLAQSLLTDNWQLRIDRPTILSTSAVIAGRVGKRYDVIRKRANEIGESYVPFVVT